MFKASNFCLILSVFIMSFLVGYYVLSWEGPPAGTAPANNAPAPINVSTIPQSKNAALTFPIFYDNEGEGAYYINPSGSSNLSGNLTAGSVLLTPGTAPTCDTAAKGKMYYNSTANKSYYCNGTSWQDMTGGATSSQWTTSGSNIYYNTGNVGIGTTAPGAKLTVDGSVAIDSLRLIGNGWEDFTVGGYGETEIRTGGYGYNAALSINTAYDQYAGIVIRANSATQSANLQEWQNYLGNALTVVDESGNVGIGTTGPGYQLTVKGPYASAQALISSDGSNGIFFQAQGAGTHTNWMIGQQRTVSGLEFTPSTAAGGTTFTTPAMVILTGGNVGIGTTSPGAKLDVSGSARVTGVSAQGYDYRNVLMYHSYVSPGKIKIKTGIPFTNLMPKVHIRGYAYGKGQVVDFTIIWYVYSNAFTAYSASSQPNTWFPSYIKLGKDASSGNVNIVFDNEGIYYPWYYVSVEEALGTNISNYTSGWSTVDEDMTTETNVVTVSYNNSILTGNVGIGTTDPGTSKLKVTGTIESTSGGFKFPDATTQITAATLFTDCKLTTATHNGNFGGWAGLQSWLNANGCNGYHLCESSEVSLAFVYGDDCGLARDTTFYYWISDIDNNTPSVGNQASCFWWGTESTGAYATTLSGYLYSALVNKNWYIGATNCATALQALCCK